MKEPSEVMPNETAEVFRFLKEKPSLASFILVGGTGLTLHIGHRKSEDLDLITLAPRLPRMALRQLEMELEKGGFTVVLTDDPAAYDEFQVSGLDIRDYNQNFLINETVRVTFFSADPPHARLLAFNTGGSGFRIASFQELCDLKAIVAASRSKSRDWVDLFVLETQYQFGLKAWKNAYDRAGLTDSHFETALNRICSGKVSHGDEGYHSLMPTPPALEEITAHFRRCREQYEVEMARQLAE